MAEADAPARAPASPAAPLKARHCTGLVILLVSAAPGAVGTWFLMYVRYAPGPGGLILLSFAFVVMSAMFVCCSGAFCIVQTSVKCWSDIERKGKKAEAQA